VANNSFNITKKPAMETKALAKNIRLRRD